MEEKKEIYIAVTLSGKAFAQDANTLIWFERPEDYDNQIKERALKFNTVGDAMKWISSINNSLGTTLYKAVNYLI